MSKSAGNWKREIVIDINQENDTIIKKKASCTVSPFPQKKTVEKWGAKRLANCTTYYNRGQHQLRPSVHDPKHSQSFCASATNRWKKKKKKTRSKNNFRKIKIAILNLPKNLDKHCQNFIKVLPCEFPRVALTSLTVEGFNGRTSCDLSELMIGLKSFCEFFLTAKVTADCSRQLIIGM